MKNVTLRRVLTAFAAVEKLCVTYCECVSVALGFQHAMCMRPIVICGLSVSTVFLFSQFLTNGIIFEKRH
jgi:hypothetical protein